MLKKNRALRIGDTITLPWGNQSVIVIAQHPFGTYDVEAANGRRWRVSGFAIDQEAATPPTARRGG